MESPAQQAGSEFFLKRLKRARQAVDAGDASPEAQAFVASVPIIESIAAGLPLGGDLASNRPPPPPALPRGRDTAERVLLAVYQHALIKYRCPNVPVHPVAFADHIMLYGVNYFRWDASIDTMLKSISKKGGCAASAGGMGGRGAASRASAAAGNGVPRLLCGAAAQALHLFGTGEMLLVQREDDAAHERVAAAVALLSQPAQRLEAASQLAQLAAQHAQQQGGSGGDGAQPPITLTVDRLLFMLHRILATDAVAAMQSGAQQAMLGRDPTQALTLAEAERMLGAQQRPSAAQRRLGEVADTSIDAMMQLEPDNPRCHFLVAERMVHRLDTDAAAGTFARAVQLARQQRSDYWLAYAAVRQANTSTIGAVPGEITTLYQEAEAALRRCKKVLPQPWTHKLSALVEAVGTSLGQLAATSQMLDAVGAASIAAGESQQQRQERVLGAAGMAVGSMARGMAASTSSEGPPRCDCCQQVAVGLRRCARCRRVSYCSRECQTRDWSSHRALCGQLVAAAAAAAAATADAEEV